MSAPLTIWTNADLSQDAFAAHRERQSPKATARSWGSASHLTQSPDLWAELAALKSDPAARPFGPWVRAARTRARTRVDRELRRRLDAMADAVTDNRTTEDTQP